MLQKFWLRILGLSAALCFASSVCVAEDAIDVPSYTQIDMQVPPTKPTHVTTVESVQQMIDAGGGGGGTNDHTQLINRNAADQHTIGSVTGLQTQLDGKASASSVTSLDIRVTANETELGKTVKFQPDGNLKFPAGMKMQVDVSGVVKDVLSTDTNGNILLGEDDEQVNIVASQRPTMTVGTGGAAVGIAGMTDLALYATEAYVDAADALKADLVGGKVPLSQLPPEVQTNFWSVPTSADLVTLTSATQGDIAIITTGDEAGHEYALSTNDPTVQANWILLSGGGGGGGGVVSWAGKQGVVVPVMSDISDSASVLGDYALQSSLATYAPLNSPALTGTPTAPNPPANASGQEIMTAAGLRTALTGNLGSIAPPMDGTGSAGSATTVARSDHVHPTDTTRASTAQAGAATTTTAGSAGLAVLAADDDVTSRDRAATPAGVAAQIAAGGGGGGVTLPISVPVNSFLAATNGNTASSIRMISGGVQLLGGGSDRISVSGSTVTLSGGVTFTSEAVGVTPTSSSPATTIATKEYVDAHAGGGTMTKTQVTPQDPYPGALVNVVVGKPVIVEAYNWGGNAWADIGIDAGNNRAVYVVMGQSTTKITTPSKYAGITPVQLVTIVPEVTPLRLMREEGSGYYPLLVWQ